MADDLVQQVSAQAGTGAGGGLVGAVITYLITASRFAKQQDIELAVSLATAKILQEVSEKYAHKDDLTDMKADITYIRQRIDQIVDKK